MKYQIKNCIYLFKGGCEPPRKKIRKQSDSEVNMQQQVSNGVIENGASCSANGHGDTTINGVSLNPSTQEIVRIIGQYLNNEGLR